MGIISDLADVVARAKSGESYQQGYNDAVNRRGKSEQIVKLKNYLRSGKGAQSMMAATKTIVENYEEGYQDGLEQRRADRPY